MELKTTIALACRVLDPAARPGSATVGFRWSVTTTAAHRRIRTLLTRWALDGAGFESCGLFSDIRCLASVNVARANAGLATVQHAVWVELARQAAEQMGFRPAECPPHGRVLLWPDDARGPMLKGPDPIAARLALSGVIGAKDPPMCLPALSAQPAQA